MANNKEQNIRDDRLAVYVHEGCHSCQTVLSCTTKKANQT